jgi:membrane-bound lytic murein transglycosylase F
MVVRALRAPVVLLLCATVSACAPAPLVDQIQARGELRVLTRPGPATYFFGAHGAGGIDYELATRLAEELNVRLAMVPVEQTGDLLAALARGEADLGAAHLTPTAARDRTMRFSTPLFDTQPVLVYRRGSPAPTSIDDIGDERIGVVASSSHIDLLKRFSERVPALKIDDRHRSIDELLEAVNSESVAFAVADKLVVEASLPMFPALRVGPNIGDPQPVAWAIGGPTNDPSMAALLERFFKRLESTGELHRIVARYRSDDRDQDEVEAAFFLRHLDERLPRYQALFESAAAAYDLDWRLLAAVGYQESHWNPRARSPTGVRGLMMLTRDTAERLGVSDRLDPAQSIHGGARYLREMLDQMPDRIDMPDRLKFALAAYNVGIGHFEDARRLTVRRGGDPDRWDDVRATLPLLSRAAWFQHTRLGRAPGGQAVEFVGNVEDYLRTLEWHSTNVALSQAASAEQAPAAPASRP